MIEVRLFATFREGREKIQFLDPNQFKIAGEVLDHLDIPHEQVAIYLINGRHSKFSDDMKDGQDIAVFNIVTKFRMTSVDQVYCHLFMWNIQVVQHFTCNFKLIRI